MKKPYLLAITLVAVSAGAALYWMAARGRTQPVRVVSLENVALTDTVSTNGKVEAEQVFEIRVPFTGLCRRVFAKEGALLKRGDALLALDESGLRSDLAGARAELRSAELDQSRVTRGPAPEELNQAEAESVRLGMELANARKTLETNEWLLQRNAISKLEVEQSRREVARVQQALDASETRVRDLKGRFGPGDLSRARARVDAARARVRLLELNLARAVVRAPADGTLYDFEVNEGAYLDPATRVGVMADLTRLRVRAFVDEPELGRVAPGSDVTIRWDARPQESWKATVQQIPSEVVARGTRSVAEVLCRLNEPVPGLIPNLNVDVEITTGEGPRADVLPRRAVFHDGTEHFVWVVRNGEARRALVETGRSTPQFMEIASGISTADPVILPGDAPLSEGVRVRIEQE